MRYLASPLLLLGFAALLALPSPAASASLNRNEAHIRWKSAETPHFRFTYPADLEEVAGYIAGIAEEVAEDKQKRYNLKLPGKTEFIVREDIFSNGWANSFQNTMTVWTTDWDFPIRSTHNWLKDVVTHEFSHLVSIQSGAKLPNNVQGLFLAYQDFYNERVQGSYATLLPFMHQPNWFAEGVAQYESELSGFDAWDSHRDMILRQAALNGKLLSYHRMGTFAGNTLEYEQGPYTQGFAFTRYLAQRFGDAALLKLWAEHSRIHRQTLSGAMRRVLGRSGEDLWEDWKNEITRHYGEQQKAQGPLVMGKKITSKGFYNYYPRFDSKGKAVYFIGNPGEEDFRGSLQRHKLADSAKKEEDRYSAVPGGVRGYFDILGDDSTFLYHSARDRDENAMRKFDVYERNVLEKGSKIPFKGLFVPPPSRKRFTRNLNAVQASYDRKGERMVFVRAEKSNFYLCLAPRSLEEGSGRKGRRNEVKDNEAVKTLWPSDSLIRAMSGGFGFNVYSPRFSPDGKTILFSYFDGRSRNVGLVRDDGTGFSPLLSAPFDERDPEWAPDGKSFFYASDSTGIYNIYRYEMDSGRKEALTRVLGGAFSPAVSPDGSRLAYSNYDRDGFSLYLLPLRKPADSAKPVAAAAPDSAAARSGNAAASPPAAAPVSGVSGAPESGAPAPSAIALPLTRKSEAVTKNTAAIEPVDLAGIRRDYLPLPNRFIVTPLLLGQETTPKGRSAQSGETKWMTGVEAYGNDPVRKNEVSASLLFEIGKGLDYLGANDELVNPDKESEIGISLSNHSLPVSLGLGFARANRSTYDTVTTVRGNIDDRDTVIGRQNYALTQRIASASLTYDLFDAAAVSDYDKSSLLGLSAGYAESDFNFYEEPFAFNYYQDRFVTGFLTLTEAEWSDKAEVAPTGLSAFAAYTYSLSGLIRQGTFRETFVFEDGVLKANLREYALQNLDLGLSLGFGLPWSDKGSLVFTGVSSNILAWSAESRFPGNDTLDDFFEKGLYLRGYPYLRDRENLAFSGEKTLQLSFDLNQPLLPDLYRGFWIFFFEDLYAHLFYEAGRAWTGGMGGHRLFSGSAWAGDGDANGWFQSAGGGFRLKAKSYNNYPFMLFIEASRALNRLPDGAGGFSRIPTVKLGFGDGEGWETGFTRLEFGISFGFYNGLLSRGRRPAESPAQKGGQRARNPAGAFFDGKAHGPRSGD